MLEQGGTGIKDGGTIMSARTDAAEAYFEAFGDNDHEKILSLLTEDVVWEVYGRRSLRGREAFASEIVGEGFRGGPDLKVERVLESEDAVVVPHTGETRLDNGTPFRFAACDILTFEGD